VNASPGPAARVLHRCCDACAVAGGLLLLAMAGMTAASVVGRAFFARPVPGDVELVQLGAAVCIALFLPYTQLRGGNIIVDVFTARASPRAKSRMDGFGAVLYTLAMALIAWRLAAGALSALQSRETSMLMGFPIWIAYLLMVPGVALAAAVGVRDTARHWSGRAASDS
jgi:TRAP-type C4-dicarboxylate transport system permease small subunit